ncbi:ABC transporter ATP-binding protein [Microlunatus sp. GCM10028923]|uniref:ABC transporter ATP-binding protein n=1 Tax=Microlunatus sp. GCM10028923 TaxID=3273400 RepID=UPI00360CEC42
MDPLLSVTDLKAYYRTEAYGVSRTVRAVDGVSFDLYPNEIYGLAGESSCGKTTLIKVISGNIKNPLRVVGGQVRFTAEGIDRDMVSMTSDELRKTMRWKQISYVMQGSMSVLNPVRRILRTFADIVATHRGIRDRAEFRKEMSDHVARLGLPSEVLHSFPHQLSGGMRQRVAIALATIFHPKLIIADEPTTALDVVVQRGVLQMLKQVQAESRNTVLLVTHDMAVHANVADRVMIMYAGRIMEEGVTETIFQAPRHPYTKHLIASLPKIGERTARASLPGSPPNLSDPPAGCRFHPRCPAAMDVCRTVVPETLQLADRHRVACHAVAMEEGLPLPRPDLAPATGSTAAPNRTEDLL